MSSLYPNTQCPGIPMKSDSQTSDSLNVSVNQTIKLACKKYKYYGWVCTNAQSDKSAAHWRAWAPLKDLQAIEQCTCEKVIWLKTKESARALNFAIILKALTFLIDLISFPKKQNLLLYVTAKVSVEKVISQ